MKRMILLAALLGLGTLVADDASAGTTRREAVKAADTDNNFRLDGKEAKNLKKSNREMYDNLRAFCDVAADAPKKNGVELPDAPTKDQSECKKKHIAKAFLLAWIAQTEQSEAPPPPAPVDDNMTPSGGAEKSPSGG